MGYRPRVRRGASTYDLPLPVMQMGERFSRRVKVNVVPLQGGVFASESTRDALQISFSGMIAVGNPQDSSRDIGMVTNIMTERRLLIEALIEADEPLVFYTFIAGATIGGTEYNSAAGTRWFRDCYCIDLAFDRSNQTKFHLPYAFTLLVPDGLEYYVE